MCGIFGWVLGPARHQDRETLIRLTDLMSHRGPDGSGTRQVGPTWLGHTRLAIVDNSNGGNSLHDNTIDPSVCF